jgi:hypothetical protein
MSKQTAADYRPGTKRYLIAQHADNGATKREAFQSLRPLVESQTKPMIFSANVGGHRVPKTMSEQLIELKNEIGRVYALLGRAASSDFDSEEITPEATPEPITVPEEAPEEIPEEEGSKPRAKGKKSVQDEMRYFLRRLREIRRFCEERAEMSEPIDEIGMRPAQVAAKLIPAGIPADALLNVLAMTWPKDARNDAGIPDFDFLKLSRQIGEEREIDMAGKHEMFPYVLTLAEERIPIFLIGPMGTGKSTLCEQLATYLELPYGETACSAGATRGDFYGRLTASDAKPFIVSKFTEMHGGGGVFNFEEIDAALPEVLIALNNALAGKKFFNSSNGEEYHLHPDLIPVATGNTPGTGANRLYNARERLDAATLDRWRMGRVFLRLDQALEEEILFGRV